MLTPETVPVAPLAPGGLRHGTKTRDDRSAPEELPRGGRPRWSGRLFALALAALAILMPVDATAHALVGDAPSRLAAVALGVWIFKSTLLFHALLLLAAPRIRLAGDEDAPLAALSVPGGELRPREWWPVAGILVVAAAVRLTGLNDGLWFDEIWTLVDYVRGPLGRTIATFDTQNNHLLYSAAARGSIGLFGDHPWALRLPAAIFGVASLAGLYWFARTVTGRLEAVLATALLAASYHHVWFSQNARGYTALLLWSLLASGLFLRLLAVGARPDWRRPLLYGMTAALAMYTHITAIFVIAAHALVWVALLWRARNTRRSTARWPAAVAFALAGTLSLQLYALVVPQFLGTIAAPSLDNPTPEWQNPVWLVAETVKGLSRGLPGGWVLLAGGMVVAAAGVLSYGRQSRTVLAVLLLPGVITLAAVLGTGHNLWPRFFFFAAGFALLIAVRGVFAVAQLFPVHGVRRIAVAALVLVILASAFTVPRAWQPKQNYDGPKAYIERERVPDDAVVALDMAGFVYERYYHTDWPRVRSDAELARIDATHPRTWVVLTFPMRVRAVRPEIWARLERDYATVAEFGGTVGSGAVYVLVRR